MSNAKAQARREYGKSCELRKDAPDYLKQEGNHAKPELIEMIRENHRKTQQVTNNLNGGKPLMKDNGC